MEAVFEGFAKVLVEMGLPGLVIGGLSYMNYMLYRANEKKQEAIVDLTREMVTANATTTAALTRLSDLLLNGRNTGT